MEVEHGASSRQRPRLGQLQMKALRIGCKTYSKFEPPVAVREAAEIIQTI